MTSPPLTARYMLAVLVATIGSSYQFFNLNVVNNLQSVVSQWIDRTYSRRFGCSTNCMSEATITIIWSVLTTAATLGAVVGCLLQRTLAEKLGRRNSLLAGSALTLAGGVAILPSKVLGSPELLIVGRFLNGINIGLASGMVPLYLTEISTTEMRGAAASIVMMAIATADMTSLAAGLPWLLGSEGRWPLAFLWSCLPAVLSLALLPYCPESPKYLMLTMKRLHRSQKALVHLMGQSQSTAALQRLLDESKAMSQIEGEAVEGSQSKHPSVSELWGEGRLRRPLLISCTVMVGQQFSGVLAIFSYSSQIFQQIGLPLETSQVSTAVMGFAYFCFVVPSIFLIERLGRRTLMLSQQFGCAASLALLSLSLFLSKNVPAAEQLAAWAGAFFVMVFMCVYGFGAAVPWLIGSELFSQRYRSTAVLIDTTLAFCLGFVIQLSYLPFQMVVGAELSFLPFIIVSIISGVAVYWFLPETKNRSIEDIVKGFEGESGLRRWSRSAAEPEQPNSAVSPSAQAGGNRQLSRRPSERSVLLADKKNRRDGKNKLGNAAMDMNHSEENSNKPPPNFYGGADTSST